MRRGSSLGETLDGLPGVSSTYFGPNANRPVIRGLDGDRVRILSNAGASLDASSLSYDHAVPIDPLIVDRIEVLRGPGALFYGGSAVGGVVNALDNRIPRAPLTGLSGSAEVRLGGANRERGGAAVLETGNGQFAVHADVFGRDTSDQRVPRYTPVEDGEPLGRSSRVRNSASETRGGSLGGSLFFGDGGTHRSHRPGSRHLRQRLRRDRRTRCHDQAEARPRRLCQRTQGPDRRAAGAAFQRQSHRLPAQGNRRQRRGGYGVQQRGLRLPDRGRARADRSAARRDRRAARRLRFRSARGRSLRAQDPDAKDRPVRT